MKNKRGFTLVELLVVISIIGMLASVVLAALQSARTKAGVSSSLSFETNVYHSMGDTLFAMWSFDDGAVGAAANLGSSIKDSSINNLTGVLNPGLGPTTWVSGVAGSALSFTGQMVTVTTPQNFGSSALTITTWVNPANYSAQMYMIERGPSSISWGLLFQAGGNIRFSGTGAGGFTCSTPPALGTWHNITATLNSTAATIYVDGKVCATGATFTIDNSASAGNIYIGGQGGATPNYLTGSMDITRLYSQAISAREVQEIYAQGPSHSVAVK